MRLFCLSCFLLLSALVFVHAKLVARQKSYGKNPHDASASRHYETATGGRPLAVKRPTDGGIREIIPNRLREKYQKWKDELLSTDFGRRQWEKYAANKNFVLNIVVRAAEGQGAGTGEYQWDERGELVGATITLGSKIDGGFPKPAYFPVMNSLLLNEPDYKISGDILAATKIAHEFGHVNQTARTNSEFFNLQNKLIPTYNRILLDNGYNTRDRRLIELVEQMGGTPVEIWENREYWGETDAMLYLLDRINNEDFYCPVFNRIKRNIEIYAKNYQERFNLIAESAAARADCR